ncbi:hypothetical protein SERLA73DRAFT_189665 [Serpula lacrymans var. lacrymans S7.3]|uniref:Aldehyde dehydrogenase domain-containing protein n=2 Tax=Serpula lacrymans var. lacrymans TaxID=341189 RepID=F8QEC4_SERL3|nr:uncharacterized protein SERLADRAFT_480566 [Serpula lacrymans var. lacrymans S7.9]EGN93499.1 hypothetical protein SERLA73DRAFT_189665 [Serpula lacrymans var. lacrymans S7.3]EGO18880.1 hypothetical protein SERLADRAFT_480566 [Serpula lacrymans var. lacrymans S7.9]
MSSISFKDNFTHIIGGQKVSSALTRDVINPATEEVVASVPVATKEQLDAAIDAAATAFPAWAATPLEQRQSLVEQVGILLNADANQFAEILVKEGGKTKSLADLEVGGTAAWMLAAKAQFLSDEIIIDTPDRRVVSHYVPLGVCAALTPWNFPLTLLIWKVVPALVTGNCLIVKPSPYAPLAAMKFVELAQRVLPPGVLSVLSGDDDLGPWISTHPRIARISLTGSLGAGRAIMKAGSATLKRLTLELSGNDPAIVLDDVDPKVIAPQIFWNALLNSGQICVALKRIYIHDKIYDAVRDELVAFAKTIRVGNGMDPETALGPVQNKDQFTKAKTFLEDCKRNGHTIALGGTVDESQKGYFIPVTIIDNPPDNSKVVREEPFAPILPLMRWSDEDDVIARANDSEYGLGATVWGNDLTRAQSIARRLEAGTVWINEAHQFHWDQPFGGFKLSGLGVEHSKYGLSSWTNIQTITLKKSKT